jgi:urease accessory protein UreE
MLVEAPIAHLDDAPLDSASANVDWVDITWSQCAARAFRKTSRGGREFRFLLRLGVVLKHRDVIWRDGDVRVGIHVQPCPVIVGQPPTMEAAIAAAFEIGNLHLPLQCANGELISLDDGPVQEAFEAVGVPYTRQTRRFEPTSRGTLQITLADSFQVIRRS